LIPFDDAFKMLTLPTTPKGTAKVDFRLGVKINNIYYSADALLEAGVEKTQVPVRYDPFDAGVAHAFVKGRWVRCISEHSFAGRSEREIMLASAELRRRNQHHAQQFLLTARKMGDFLTSTESEESLLQQRLQDAEGQDVLRIIGGDRAAEDRPVRSAPAGSPRPELAECVDGDATGDTETLVLYEDYR
jgi:putative transposase